ncbi:MAG: hypothetical protein KF850_08235 [Labilithrix sp.]|nr:hypothetical protein [Labilithrix sp.]MBX3212006.1 hypothetical protein [Labilithrix sp.]
MTSTRLAHRARATLPIGLLVLVAGCARALTAASGYDPARYPPARPPAADPDTAPLPREPRATISDPKRPARPPSASPTTSATPAPSTSATPAPSTTR